MKKKIQNRHLKSNKNNKSSHRSSPKRNINYNKSLGIVKAKHQASRKSKSVCPQNCKNHIFEIRKIGYNQKLNNKGVTAPVSVSFCSISTGITLPTIIQAFSQQPQIPMFINQEDIQKYSKFLNESRTEFQRALKQARNSIEGQSNIEEIYRPIPKSTQCQVCRQKFDDYEAHINSSIHYKAVYNSFGHKLIGQQLEQMEQIKKKELENKINTGQLKEVAKILRNSKKMVKGLLTRMMSNKIVC